MSAIVHNYAVRLTRKLQKPNDRGQMIVHDKVINEIAFIEGGAYSHTISNLVESFNKIELPEDIMIEMVHNWVGQKPKGSPLRIETALAKDGYVCPSDVHTWFDHDGGGTSKRKFIVQDVNCQIYLKLFLWNESSLKAVKWEQSEVFKKAVESNRYVSSLGTEYEWWM